MERVRELLDQLSKVEVGALERRGMEFNFSDVYDRLKLYFDGINQIKSNINFVESLPEARLNNLTAFLNQLSNAVGEITNFVPTTLTEPGQKRDNIANQILGLYQLFYDYLYTPLRIHLMEKEITGTQLEELIHEVNVSREAIYKQREEADRVLDAIKKAAGEVGIGKYADVFGRQARIHIVWAIFWGVISFCGAAGIGVFLFSILGNLTGVIKAGGDIGISLQVFFAKIIIVSFFSLVFFYLVKNFTANMHLYTVNKHRRNSLVTFRSFIEATDDEQTKNAVLIQACRAIFETGDSGFTTSREGRGPSLETVKIFDHLGKTE